MASEDLPANGHGGPADHFSPASDDKPRLRRQFRAARDASVAALSPAERRDLEAALAAVLDANLPAGRLAGYAAVGSELALTGLARPFALPRVIRDAPLTFHVGEGPLVPAAFAAIPEPLADAPVVDPDIILVPLLAVDHAGNRLGQGGGYYDRTLALLRARRSVLAIGIAWEGQIADALPADPWDAALDAVATPQRWLECVRPAKAAP